MTTPIFIKSLAATLSALSLLSGPVLAQETADTKPAESTPPVSEPAAQPQATAPTTAPRTNTQTAPWQICNETSFALRLAVATTVDEKIQPRGWEKVRAGSCLTVDAAVTAPRFVYAQSSPAHRGGIREWKGDVILCAGEEDFKADSAIGCALQNLSTREYITVDPSENVTTLVEIEDFGRKAATAGVQRLLKDNGYAVTRVDGLAGRRTSKTLSKFLSDSDLPSSLTPEEQLDALEEAAIKKVQSVGLTVCNKSSAKIWAATARRRKGNWESRGWWKLDMNSCGQLFNESLTSADLSFYAIQEGIIDDAGAKGVDRPLRSPSATPNQFCVSDSQFAVSGRTNCAEQGYGLADFRALPIDKDGATVDLTDADFSKTNASGLR